MTEHERAIETVVQAMKATNEPDEIAAALVAAVPELVDRRRAHALVEEVFERYRTSNPDFEIETTTQPFARGPRDGFEALVTDRS